MQWLNISEIKFVDQNFIINFDIYLSKINQISSPLNLLLRYFYLEYNYKILYSSFIIFILLFHEVF